jgi:hypothetical protein
MNNRMINLFAFAVLTLLWLAFLAALVFNRELLDAAWQAFRSWPLVVQVIAGLLVLPVAAGLWIWETSWPFLLRLVLVFGLALATVYLFFPRKAPRKPGASPA